MKRERRFYQNVALVVVREVRQLALYWARRCRKSTTLGDIAFDEMSKESARLVIAASASLLLGKELVGVTLSAAEQAMIVANESAAMRTVFENGAEEKQLDFKVADSTRDKIMTGLTPEDFAELYQSSRMELRLYFSHTRFSKLQIIAPNPATARSWRATVLRDEAGFTNPNFENDLRIATDPMMRDTPDLKIIYASNLSGNARHPYFTTTLPREITAETEDEQFPANPNGHLYIGQDGILVHRVSLKDAYAAGHCLFNDRSEPMTYDECRSFPQFKSGWDETYALNHKSGGSAAIDFLALISAQRRGVGRCNFVYAENESDIRRAGRLLAAALKDGRVGIGWDVASTTEEKSNPSSVTFTESLGGERFQRLVVVFKLTKEDIARAWVLYLIDVVRSRPRGGPAERLCIDGSNERLFAQGTKDKFAATISTEIILNGSPVDPQPPGYLASINYKTYLGDLYSASVNEGRTALPPDEYIKKDHLLPLKDAGKYSCPVDADGRHGDTFDSGKNAEYALEKPATGVRTPEDVARIHTGGNPLSIPQFTPRRLMR
ncbi:MAG: hypothetical protein PHQ12_04715 [Chthoniobacteraceae bacterium]|nr:hypothetical protein [Chthoniobacteraceae bacterium]